MKYFIQEQPLAHLVEYMCHPCVVCNNTAIIEGLLQSTTKDSDACGLQSANKSILGCGQGKELYPDWGDGNGPELMTPALK